MHSSPLVPLSASPGDHPFNEATLWDKTDFPDDRSWVHSLTDAMRSEIRATTLSLIKRAGRIPIDPASITREDFPLPVTEPLLTTLYREIEFQQGFSLLEGFLFDDFDEDQLRIAYCGLCSHFGDITVQNRAGETILEVTDKGKAYDQTSRGYHSRVHLDFHNDGTNTVTLLCQQTAAEGGLSKLVSGPAVYQHIAATRPDCLEALVHGFHHHKRDQLNPGDNPVTEYRTPVFSFREGVFHMAYAGPSIHYCEQEGIEITDHEKQSLAWLEQIIAKPELQVTMELRRGDIQFVNNYVVLHARTAYRDAPGQVRRLLRLWLDDKNSRRLGPGKMDWYMPDHSRFSQLGGTRQNTVSNDTDT